MLYDYLSKYKAGFKEYTELRAQLNSEFAMSIDKDGNISVTSTSRGGVSARIYSSGVYGFAAAPEYDDEHVQWVIKQAKRNADLMSGYVRKPMVRVPDIACGVVPINYDVQSIDRAAIREVLIELKRYADSKYPSCATSIHASNNTAEKLLIVQNGYGGRSNNVLGKFGISMSKEIQGSEKVDACEAQGIGIYLNDFIKDTGMLYAMVDKAYEKLEKELEERSIAKINAEGGEWDCILSPQFTGMLAHEAVGHTCEADAVVLKDSVAAAYMGKQVASELVSLTDFANRAYGESCPINMTIDDEGVLCKDAPIIKDGILVGCMNNRDTAARLGIEPTGNARASEYCDEPIIRMRNTCFHPGTSKLDDMIASIDKGYYLVESGGGNGSLKGEFNMTVRKAYEIVDGKLGCPIKPTMTAGIAWDALKTVTMVSDNFCNSKDCGICGKKQSIPTSQGGPEMKMRLNIGGQ